jgi:hypothetical protein
MTEDSPRDRRADAAASVALFGVILALSIILAVTTDMHVVLRGAIAIVAGVVAAAVTFAVVRRRPD